MVFQPYHILVFFRHGLEIVVGGVHLISREFVCVSIVWDRYKIFPSGRDQDGFTILSVIVQDRFEEGFVMVRVGLRTDERRVQSHVDLLEEAVSQIVDDPHHVGCRQIVDCVSGVFLEHELHFEFAFTQVQEIVLRINLKGHRVDPRIERIDLDPSSSGHAEICGGCLEHV